MAAEDDQDYGEEIKSACLAGLQTAVALLRKGCAASDDLNGVKDLAAAFIARGEEQLKV